MPHSTIILPQMGAINHQSIQVPVADLVRFDKENLVGMNPTMCVSQKKMAPGLPQIKLGPDFGDQNQA